jgi:hypothetical protein
MHVKADFETEKINNSVRVVRKETGRFNKTGLMRTWSKHTVRTLRSGIPRLKAQASHKILATELT